MPRRSSSFYPNAPTKGLWVAALIIGGLGILSRFVYIQEISKYNYWMLLIGFALLVIGTSSKRM